MAIEQRPFLFTSKYFQSPAPQPNPEGGDQQMTQIELYNFTNRIQMIIDQKLTLFKINP